jgi:hypothetical protein
VRTPNVTTYTVFVSFNFVLDTVQERCKDVLWSVVQLRCTQLPKLTVTVTSHHFTSHHITSHHIASHHIISCHITSHHTTSHHITSHPITSHHYIVSSFTFYVRCAFYCYKVPPLFPSALLHYFFPPILCPFFP